ncbi:lipid A deacylase LpxR family protein [Microbulbifer sp. TB1203]|uniref:lipid A deacylase LpxR family protein n=1 Tax=Microbulbifer sp. TB1203 TaxID=3021712 RepID=UPI0027E3C557|nr:lipid A deacylase LpxR family protein [Microbulbifer sp. TB1203]
MPSSIANPLIKEIAIYHQFFRKRLGHLAIAALIVSSAPDIAIAETAGDTAKDSSLQAITLRIDNDLFAGNDRGYSNGVGLGFLSQTVDNFQDERLPASYRGLNNGLTWLQPKGYTEYNMALGLGHGIFTPGDWRQGGLIEDDRPYAGVLVVGVKYNGRNDCDMRSTSFDIGIVGPSARGKELQQGVHKLVGSEKFRGWDNQIGDEIVFRLSTRKLRRFQFKRPPDTWQQDLILRSGGSIGNLSTYADIGAEWRFGPRLPDNFGSAPLLPVSENTVPTRNRAFMPRLEIHGFVTLSLRAVFHDITLDGNTWKDSHSVQRNPLVADLGVGVAGSYGKWKFAFARYLRSREFEEQAELPQLGSLAVWRDL